MTSRPITTRDSIRHGRPVNASAGYGGPVPRWTCPFCGTTNRRASLADVRPEGVADACPCGAKASPDYQEATR